MRGDHIKVKREWHSIPLYYHHGIEISDNRVIHYGEGSLTAKKGSKVIISSMKDFLKGGKKEVVVDKDKDMPDIVVKRARSCLGDSAYNIMFNNCEHFAQWAETGKSSSTQVKTGIAAGVGGALGIVAGVMLKRRFKIGESIEDRIDYILNGLK
jgi:hypothetical protein